MQLIVTRGHYEQARGFQDALLRMDVEGRAVPGFTFAGRCPLARAARETFQGWHCSVGSRSVFLSNDEGEPFRVLSFEEEGFRIISAFDRQEPWPYGNRDIAISLTDTTTEV
jgi:hypothetical protein